MKKSIRFPFYAPSSTPSRSSVSNQNRFPELNELLDDLIGKIIEEKFKTFVEKNDGFEKGKKAWNSLQKIEEFINQSMNTRIYDKDVINEIRSTQNAIAKYIDSKKTDIIGEIQRGQEVLTESQTSGIRSKLDRNRVYIKRLLRVCVSSIEKKIERSVSGLYLNVENQEDKRFDNPFAVPVRILRDDLFKQISEDVESKIKNSQEETRKRIDLLNKLILFLFVLSGLSVAGIITLLCLSFR